MDDDIFERLGKSLLIMAGGFGFLYLMITGTQTHPKGVALVIVKATEAVFKWLLIAGGTTCGIILAWMIMDGVRTKRRKKIELMENEKRKIESLKMAEQEKIRRLEEQRKTQMEDERRVKEQKTKQDQMKADEEAYLKTRTADDAAKDALKHFM